MTFGTQQHIWNSMTKYEYFKIQDGGRPPFQKSSFGHNSAANFSEILRWQQFLTEFR